MLEEWLLRPCRDLPVDLSGVYHQSSHFCERDLAWFLSS